MDKELTRTSRLSAMLIVAALALPCIALAGILVLRRYVIVRYTAHTLTLWLVLDAAIFAVGLILGESGSLQKASTKRRRTARKGKRR